MYMNTIMDIFNDCTHQSTCCRLIQNATRSMIPLVRPFLRTRVSLVSAPSIPASGSTWCPCPRIQRTWKERDVYIIFSPHVPYIIRCFGFFWVFFLFLVCLVFFCFFLPFFLLFSISEFIKLD